MNEAERTGGTPSDRVWVCRAGPKNSLADGFRSLGIAGLIVPFMANATQSSRDEIAARLSSANRSHALNMAAMLRHFIDEIALGDLVITPAGRHKALLVGRIHGDYYFESSPAIPGLCHQRRVRWELGPEWQLLPVSLRRRLSAPVALYRIAAASVLLAELEAAA